MRRLSEMLCKPNQRCLLLGQTGSGKTTLARRLLEWRTSVVCYDGKGRLDWPGYRVVRELGELSRVNPERPEDRRLVYRPDPENMQDPADGDAFCRWILARGDTTLYVDEVLSLVENGTPAGYVACMTRGRELGVEVWNAVQRPSHVPLNVLSEADVFYVFRLNMREDRRRVEEVCGLPENRLAGLPVYQFYLVRVGEEPAGPYKLRLEG